MQDDGELARDGRRRSCRYRLGRVNVAADGHAVEDAGSSSGMMTETRVLVTFIEKAVARDMTKSVTGGVVQVETGGNSNGILH